MLSYIFLQLQCSIPFDQLSMLQLLSSHAQQKLSYKCASQTYGRTDDMRLIGTDGESWRLDNKNIKMDSDGCQLSSLDEVSSMLVPTLEMN